MAQQQVPRGQQQSPGLAPGFKQSGIPSYSQPSPGLPPGVTQSGTASYPEPPSLNYGRYQPDAGQRTTSVIAPTVPNPPPAVYLAADGKYYYVRDRWHVALWLWELETERIGRQGRILGALKRRAYDGGGCYVSIFSSLIIGFAVLI